MNEDDVLCSYHCKGRQLGGVQTLLRACPLKFLLAMIKPPPSLLSLLSPRLCVLACVCVCATASGADNSRADWITDVNMHQATGYVQACIAAAAADTLPTMSMRLI